MANEIKSSEITPESVYLNRRSFIRAGLVAGTTLATGLTYRFFNPPPPKEVVTAEIGNLAKPPEFKVEEPLNTFEEITTYNNYYEFSTGKGAVARAAENFVTRPWTVEVDGLVGPSAQLTHEALGWEQAHPRCSQFDGQRQSAQQPTAFGDRAQRRIVAVHAGIDAPCDLHEEPDTRRAENLVE